jgi:hypothetical protein
LRELFGLSPVCLSRTAGTVTTNSLSETEVTNDLEDAYTRMAGLGEAYAVVGNQ